MNMNTVDRLLSIDVKNIEGATNLYNHRVYRNENKNGQMNMRFSCYLYNLLLELIVIIQSNNIELYLFWK